MIDFLAHLAIAVFGVLGMVGGWKTAIMFYEEIGRGGWE